MAKFVRKNLIVLSGVFSLPGAAGVPADTQPSSVTAELFYTNTLGRQVTTQIILAMDTDTKVWSGNWDSSDCSRGRVDWMIYSTGALVAADEGFFEIYANDANKV